MLIYDFSNLLEENIGEKGLPGAFLEKNKELLKETDLQIKQKAKEGIFGFMHLPFTPLALNQIKSLALEARGKWEYLLVLGIGGSCLGALALHRAINHPFHNLLPKEKRQNLPRVFFLDNVDPELINAVLDTIDIKKTLILVISKSGKTAETLSQFLLFFQEIEKQGNPKEQIIIITDPEKGPLRELAKKEGFTAFSVPPNVGGRYSVLSPVGLVPAALLGIDLDALLKGAQAMANRCQALDNPAYLYALTHYLFLNKGLNIHVLFPYVHALKDLADWWRQLWAESLGKEGKGPTPIKAIGVTDQHSQLQLYMQGPVDKVITFLTVKSYQHTVSIPGGFSEYPDIAYLGGHTFNELIQTEQVATEAALTKAGRPNAKIELDKVDAFNMGEFFYCLELATVCCGILMQINPLDQPGVELGKRYTQALMGREGFAEERKEIDQFLKRPRKKV